MTYLNFNLLWFEFRYKLKKLTIQLLTSKIFEYTIVSLILLYSILVFVNFGLNSVDDASDGIQESILILLYIELSILIVFSFEILANLFAYGFKVKK